MILFYSNSKVFTITSLNLSYHLRARPCSCSLVCFSMLCRLPANVQRKEISKIISKSKIKLNTVTYLTKEEF